MQKNSLLVNWRIQLLLVLGALLLLATPSLVLAQGAETKSALTAEAGKTNVEPLAKDDSWGDAKPPENFVQSKAPTKSDSPYNFVQMGYAGLVMLCMGGLIVWVIRRNTRDEDSPKEA